MGDPSAGLALAVHDGDQQAFRRLVIAYSRGLYQFCFRITRDTVLAEDAVQETFYRAWRAIDQFEGRAALSTWLYRIAANAALEQLRRNSSHRYERTESMEVDAEGDFLSTVPDHAPGPEACVFGTQIGQEISRHLDQLTPSERAVFVMRHFEGERLETIATTLSMNIGQCKQAVFRAVRKLRRLLETLR